MNLGGQSHPDFGCNNLDKDLVGISMRFTDLPVTHPWDEGYIYLHEWLIFMVNVGKYTSHMDDMG